MPLIHSGSKKALQQNMRTLHSEIGRSPHVKSRAQAVAIALSNQRRYKADGGDVAPVLDDYLAKRLPPHMIRAMGLDALKHKMWRSLGVDYVGGGPFDDTMTDEQRIRNNASGKATIDRLKDLETGMELRLNQGPNYLPQGNDGMLVSNPKNIKTGGRISAARKIAHKAFGGLQTPWTERAAAFQLRRDGFMNGVTPGRSDKLPITVGGGAYILPSDHLAAIGDGNSIAGADIVNRMFKMGPYGTSLGSSRIRGSIPRLPSMKPPKFAHGGTGSPTPIMISDGEMIIPPHKIIEKFGNMEQGHKILDKWVTDTRKKHIEQLKTLKPPKKN